MRTSIATAASPFDQALREIATNRASIGVGSRSPAGTIRDNESPVFGHVDRLTVPDPRQHLTGVVAQVSQADNMRVSSHG